MYLIGITGYIGSGKTTVGQIFKDLGFVVFDMDVWCRRMYFDPEFLKIIEKNFPQSFENDIFNKKTLRNIVFSDIYQLKKIESLTHPYLKQKLKQTIHQYKLNQNIFFIETALLYKMGLDQYCAKTIITHAPYEILQNRVMKRDKINQKEFENIFNNKDEYIDFNIADYIIQTNKPLNLIKKDVIQLIQGL